MDSGFNGMKSSFNVKDLLDLPDNAKGLSAAIVDHVSNGSEPGMTVTPLQNANAVIDDTTPSQTGPQYTQHTPHSHTDDNNLQTGVSDMATTLGMGLTQSTLDNTLSVTIPSSGYQHHYVSQPMGICDQENPYTRWLQTNGSNPYHGKFFCLFVSLLVFFGRGGIF